MNADLNNFTFTTVRNWGTTSTGVWTLKIVDTVANGIGGTLNSASVNIYGTAATGPKPQISEGGVVTARDFGGGEEISPGTWIEIYGVNLSATTRSWTPADFNGSQAPTTLDGVSVTIDGKPAFVSYISPGQINAQVPDGIGPVMKDAIVHTSQGASDPRTVAVSAIHGRMLGPARFGINGLQYVVALLPDHVRPAHRRHDTRYSIAARPSRRDHHRVRSWLRAGHPADARGNHCERAYRPGQPRRLSVWNCRGACLISGLGAWIRRPLSVQRRRTECQR
jgi:hypothetical protein